MQQRCEFALLQQLPLQTHTAYVDVNNDALLMSGYLCHICLPQPCMNNGTCTHIPAGQAGTTHYLTEQRNVSGFSCTCAAGYTGDICQTRLPCLGDADGNFVINVEDVLIVLSNFGKTPATGMNPAADVATFPVSTAGQRPHR